MERLHLQITLERKVANSRAGAKFGDKVPLRADGSLAQKVVGGEAPKVTVVFI